MPMISDRSPIAFSEPLPDAVDVVVIGAGIAGTATAFYLAEHGVRVLLCEKGRVAGEQSSRNWGWVRQQGRDWAEIPIMMEANRIWRGLAETTGDKALTFTQSSCIYVADSQASLKKYEAWLDLAKQHQLESTMLSAAEIQARLPGVRGDWIAGLVTETDGRAEPFVAVPALAKAAAKLGAVVIEDCAVRTLDIEAGRLAGVVTEKGRVRCARVVLAGGVWSTHFAANAGIDLPQLAVSSTVARTEPAPAHYAANISTPGLSVRRRADGGYTVATGDSATHYLSRASFKYFAKYLKLWRLSTKNVGLRLGAPKGYPGAWGSPRRWTADDVSPFERLRVLNPEPSRAVVELIKARLPGRYPALQGVEIAEAWAGMIDVTPDVVPLLGEDERVKGLYLATGLSGHGFGIGPAVGRITADLVRDRPPGHDLTRFRPGRFFDGSEIVPGPY